MKKTFISSILFVTVAVSSLVAAPTSLLKSINKISNTQDKSSINGAEGTIPEGKSLRSGIYLLSQAKADENNPKINSLQNQLTYIDLINDTYKVQSKIITKIAIGFSCQEAAVTIVGVDSGYKVTVDKLVTYACDASANANGEIKDMNAKYFDQMAKSYVDTINKIFIETSEEDLQAADGIMLTSLYDYYNVTNYASNKLKAKKWYNEHSIEGLPFTGKYLFWGISESKENNFCYELKFAYLDKTFGYHFFSVLSNNDEYIDLKENTEINISGIIRQVNFSDFGNEYKISDIIIEEYK